MGETNSQLPVTLHIQLCTIVIFTLSSRENVTSLREFQSGVIYIGRNAVFTWIWTASVVKRRTLKVSAVRGIPFFFFSFIQQHVRLRFSSRQPHSTVSATETQCASVSGGRGSSIHRPTSIVFSTMNDKCERAVALPQHYCH